MRITLQLETQERDTPEDIKEFQESFDAIKEHFETHYDLELK